MTLEKFFKKNGTTCRHTTRSEDVADAEEATKKEVDEE
jgi:hypothetical protein